MAGVYLAVLMAWDQWHQRNGQPAQPANLGINENGVAICIGVMSVNEKL
jgi:hypothetical protein